MDFHCHCCVSGGQQKLDCLVVLRTVFKLAKLGNKSHFDNDNIAVEEVKEMKQTFWLLLEKYLNI